MIPGSHGNDISISGTTIYVDGHNLLELAEKQAALFRIQTPSFGQVFTALQNIDIPPHMTATFLAQGLERRFKPKFIERLQG